MPYGSEPIALAMVLCDGIHIDPGTGKRTLLGLFNSACSSELPAKINQLAVYCCITECNGETPFTFKVVDVNEERDPIFETEGNMRCDDPLGIIELDLVMGGVEFPEYGEYRFQLLSAGHPLMERKLMVIDPATLQTGSG
jgi:hypothetical protein